MDVGNAQSGFVAYPSKNPSLVETINTAIEQINQAGLCTLKPWEDLHVSGKFVISEICVAIANADLFICDLTDLNHNVLFELGYAIAKGKRVWMLLNKDIEKSSEEFERLRILTTVGYVPYSNSTEITNAFYKEMPHEGKGQLKPMTILDAGKISLFYLKSAIETDSSVKLTQCIERYNFSKITDDRYEGANNLSWYLNQVVAANSILIHFSSQQHRDYRFHNAKNSFVAGLAYGHDRNLLMLAHYPYESPIDYREFLKVHATAAECLAHAKTMLDAIEVEDESDRRSQREFELKKKAQQKLQNLGVGEPVAENETEKLDEYFVETSIYKEALRNDGYLIYIGDKGSGKSATFFRLSKKLKESGQNIVCLIKPPAYQLKGVIDILRESEGISQKGHLADSLWKFLLYSEILLELYKNIEDSQEQKVRSLTDDERNIINFVNDTAPFVKLEFSERLEVALSQIKSDYERNGKMSNFFSEIFSVAKTLIGKNLPRRGKLVMLIDNLDKAWEKDSDFKILSEFLFSLLRAGRGVSLELKQMGSGHYGSDSISTVIFLRRDIFFHMRQESREPDKISYKNISWDDPIVLLRIIDERLLSAFTGLTNPDDIWRRFFTPTIKACPIKDFIIGNVLPRPRDVILLIKMAIATAVDRGNTKVEESDFLSALSDYSRIVFERLVVESGNKYKDITGIAYEFLGSKPVITRDEIVSRIEKVNSSLSVDGIIDFLCEASFIGVEIRDNDFAYFYNPGDIDKFKVMARKLSEQNNSPSRYKINRVFYPYLEIFE